MSLVSIKNDMKLKKKNLVFFMMVTFFEFIFMFLIALNKGCSCPFRIFCSQMFFSRKGGAPEDFKI